MVFRRRKYATTRGDHDLKEPYEWHKIKAMANSVQLELSNAHMKYH